MDVRNTWARKEGGEGGVIDQQKQLGSVVGQVEHGVATDNRTHRMSIRLHSWKLLVEPNDTWPRTEVGLLDPLAYGPGMANSRGHAS